MGLHCHYCWREERGRNAPTITFMSMPPVTWASQVTFAITRQIELSIAIIWLLKLKWIKLRLYKYLAGGAVLRLPDSFLPPLWPRRLFSTRCSTSAVFPVPGPPLMITPRLVGRCEERREWSSRSIHCLPINDWLDEEERGISNCNGFSDRNTCFWVIWLLTCCKCLSLNFWLEMALG